MSGESPPVQASSPRGGGNVGCLPAIAVVLLILGVAWGRTYFFVKRGVPDDVIIEAIQIRMRADLSTAIALCGPTDSFSITRIENVATQGNVHRGTGAATLTGARTDSNGVHSTCSGRVRFQYYSDMVDHDQVVQVYEIVPDR